jgi:hypothetical protein
LGRKPLFYFVFTIKLPSRAIGRENTKSKAKDVKNMATITQTAAKVAYTISGNAPEVVYYPEAASQSFKTGEFVYLVSGAGNTNRVTVCAADPTGVLGMAVHDATGVEGTQIPIFVANCDTVFEMNTNAATNEDNIGAQYGLTVSSNQHYVDISETTNKIFLTRGFAPGSAHGDTNARVFVQALTDLRQVDSREKLSGV